MRPPLLFLRAKSKSPGYRQKSSRKVKIALCSKAAVLSKRPVRQPWKRFSGPALAVENRVPEPAELNEALQAPLSLYWGEVLPAISEFAALPSSPATQIAQKLQKIADSVPP
jgi:hypothetical protein